jgi:hypothetical protein
MTRGLSQEDADEPRARHQVDSPPDIVSRLQPTTSTNPSHVAERLLAILAVRLVLASRKDGTNGTTL